ncbi:SDR family NAD(P)-dependent oxidoreductase [Brevibacillus dissolubilis]|uniref:SDR family NAD(P)-dependent oxidoreductase n=1 Tax=Brevibacillus dissolubilis TaxID=1844116 RepID=UPI0011168B92|nr:SDR family NAD(P)-dependent oxidoreductase [Brevibacillus dissolubilis]
MSDELLFLYDGIKEGKISNQDAAKQLKTLLSSTNSNGLSTNQQTNQSAVALSPEWLHEMTTEYLIKSLASISQLPEELIDPEDHLENYGIDSVMVMQLTEEMEKVFGTLSKTLFFEYQNLGELASYFVESHRNELIQLFGVNEGMEAPVEQIAATEAEAKREEASGSYISATATTNQPAETYISATATTNQQSETYISATAAIDQPAEPYISTTATTDQPAEQSSNTTVASDLPTDTTTTTTGTTDIAIIGLSGRYPGAANIHEFWKNLRDGKDSITEIPKDRWDHSLYFAEEKDTLGKTYSKWGGFLDGVDQFDPLFFNISPREAEIMDPQERLFLECVYETLEDAGYTRDALGQYRGRGMEGNVGVYVGAMYEDYQLYGAQAQSAGNPIAVSGTISSIANRVSYFCNFHGPSIAMDTMCSSSLTALHLACQSIQKGECELAIAGGVNVSIHPNKYLLLAQGKFMSTKGRCESFGDGGDGYVPGEGVGAVLLKPLEKAIADGDHIYGIIKSTAINHGGKTNGYSVPNPNAQASVIKQALTEAGVHPRTITYLEAHGTGTALGDPIEITGLTKTIREFTDDSQYCAIGSSKTNIGHLESAAGIAGLTKILLQLKHQQLVPSLHSQTLNSHIDFGQTPFVVQQELAEWPRTVLEINGKMVEQPRRAGLSSFGAGGSNAHVIIEEYIPNHTEKAAVPITPNLPAIIVLSAKSAERLKERVQRFAAAIDEQSFSNEDLADIAYTLQVGREAMEERLALMVSTIEELKVKLNQFLAGEETIADLYHGQFRPTKDNLAALKQFKETRLTSDGHLHGDGDLSTLHDLCHHWVKGLAFDWNTLYGETTPRRISLPTYPFAKNRYWIPVIEQAHNHTAAAQKPAVIHPLLHQNTSDFSEQRFSSTFSGDEFFLNDHRVKGQKVLPGVAYLEMARAAVAQSTRQGETGIRLKNVVWLSPISAGEAPIDVHIGLFPEENGEISYEVYREQDGKSEEAVVHSQGSALLIPAADDSRLNLSALQQECKKQALTPSQCYEAFTAMGLEYGPAHQGIEQVYVGQDHVLAKLSLPATLSADADAYVLHPSLMDSALQAAIGLALGADAVTSDSAGSAKPALPFALQELDILRPCTSEMWASIRYSAGHTAQDKVMKLDIDLCDEQGAVCVKLRGFMSRIFDGEADSTGLGTLILKPEWTEQLTHSEATAHTYAKHLVLLCEPEVHVYEAVTRELHTASCIRLQSESGSIDERFRTYAAQAFAAIQTIMQEKPGGNVLIQIVLPHHGEQKLFAGLKGLLKTAQLEYPKLVGQVIEVEQGTDATTLAQRLMPNSQCPQDTHIRYLVGRRFVFGWSELQGIQQENTLPWKDRGIYLITGGAGGLGLVFAREIAEKVAYPTLILTGRSSLAPDKQAKLTELEALGADIVYRTADVTQQQDVESLIQSITQEYGTLNGIIHAAGVTQDNLIHKKTAEELQNVLAPKVSGVVYLDEATKHIALDLFVLFSSVAGAWGNPGQADYSTANAFMDAYASYRNELVSSHQRHGKSLSINWPLWKEGGMHVGAETEKMMKQSMGMIPMNTASGIHAFYQGTSSCQPQIMAIEGQLTRLRQTLLSPKQAKQANQATPDKPMTDDKATTTATGTNTSAVLEKVQNILVQKVSKLLKVKMEDIDVDVELNEYGFDSVTLTELATQLNQQYKLELTPAVFFEHSTLHSFAEFLASEYQGSFGVPSSAVSSTTAIPSPNQTPAPVVEEQTVESNNVTSKRRRQRFATNSTTTTAQTANNPSATAGGPADEAIAIIGMSGKFPMADNLDEFWNNLVEGKDCITEIPRDRWDWREYHGDPVKEANKTNIKWGGFIDGVGDFDPAFFGISPREAELMDPQQRLLMTYVWKTIEDAGYSAQSLSGSKMGIFVGTSNSGYSGLIARANINIEAYSSTGMVPSVGPNRMSYFLNIHGPSEPVETACSSSLIAIHRAVLAMKNGDCDTAIVGGVNTIITPEGHISFNKAGMLCEDGRCKTFSDQANGYVRGEGVGMIFLKKVKDAEQAGDHIYAVIRTTNENHGGRATSLTAPNPKAQAELLKTAYLKGNIDPSTITYMEAHGTGTRLGDPIEINGLKAAFTELNRSKEGNEVSRAYCGLGSVKTNIGHLELAAGIAGVLKVLLQLKHKTLVQTLHCDTINPYIQLEDSPFYIVHENREWNALQDQAGNELPRRAGVSSFGFGGANAHVVIEEYIPTQPDTAAVAITPQNPAIILLSAKNEDRLKEQAAQLLTAIRQQSFTDADLADISYTLQVGRDAMDTRLGLIICSIQELQEKLQSFLDGEDGIESLYLGQVRRNRDTLAIFAADEELQEALEKWMQRKKYTKLVDMWVKGLPIDWSKLYGTAKPRRISLPTYPFAKERYWIPAGGAKAKPSDRMTAITVAQTAATIHTVNEDEAPSTVTSQSAATRTLEEAYEILTFEEIWQEQELELGLEQSVPAPSRTDYKTVVCFLSNPVNQLTLVEKLRQMNQDQDTKVIFISQGTATYQELDNHYSILSDDRDAYRETFQRIQNDHGKVDAVLYLWGLEEQACVQDVTSIVYILQAIAAEPLKPARVLLAGQYTNDLERCCLDSWIGFELSLGLMMPQTKVNVIIQEATELNPLAIMDSWTPILWQELQSASSQSVLYQHGKRHVSLIQPTPVMSETSNTSDTRTLRPGGTYLITGGLGGLGLVFARHFATQHPVHLVLVGRSALDDTKQGQIDELKALGSQVLYIQADICDRAALKEGILLAKARFGNIHGVIHAAGIESSQILPEKEIHDFHKVLNPKIKGTIVLHEVLDEVLSKTQQAEPLDFTCYFSSSSAILGDFGSCDYAIANRFQLAYARYHAHQHSAKTFVINWPLWKEGGMGTHDEVTTSMYLKSSGQRFLEKEEGVALFDQMLSQSRTQQLVVTGQPTRVYRFLGLAQEETSNGASTSVTPEASTTYVISATPVSAVNSAASIVRHTSNALARQAVTDGFDIEKAVLEDLQELVSQILKIPRNQLDAEENLAEFGFDSISLAELATVLTNHYQIEMTPATLFGHSTLEKLTRYYVKEHQEAIRAFYIKDMEATVVPQETLVTPELSQPYQPEQPHQSATQHTTASAVAIQPQSPAETTPASIPVSLSEPIAIIGMSGRFPNANTVEEFWDNIKNGKNAITEVPPNRWSGGTQTDSLESGEAQSRYGGFIPEIDKFDPLFFQISPKEAAAMDPRQRLFLEEAWHALEDAGYMGDQIRGKSCGVYVGVEEGEYGYLAGEQGGINSNQNATLAARIAYALDLRGPNFALTAACSSGLVAIHQACQALRQGECEMALAGGVNLMVSPMLHVGMGSVGMLSPDGTCSVFDQQANGLVPGEAVAVVLLKPLSKAIADQDHIYGCIKASGINYSGKTNGMTAPNPVAQAELMEQVYDRYQINPADIQYVMAHSVGSQLGDPIEVQALTSAFKSYTDEKQYCAIGSVKPLIGHTFAASGVVSLISMLMAMRDQTILALHNYESPNAYIHFPNSPFIIPTENTAWTTRPNQPRLGAISTTGISGTNAHAVIEEYIPAKAGGVQSRPAAAPQIVVMSAKNPDRLQALAQSMLAYAERTQELSLADLAYTLQAGREAMEARLAMVVTTQEELIHGLRAYLTSISQNQAIQASIPIFTGNLKEESSDIKTLLAGKAGEIVLQSLLAQNCLDQIAFYWAKGGKIPWNVIRQGEQARRIPLPTYPFEKRRCWIETAKTVNTVNTPNSKPPQQEMVKPAEKRTPVSTSELDDLVPSLDDLIPNIDDIAVSLDDLVPSLDDLIPNVDDIAASLDDLVPSLDDLIPNVDDIAASLDDLVPSLDDLIPSVDDIAASLDDLVPSLDDLIPNVDDIAASLDDLVPSLDDLIPSVDDIIPPSNPMTSTPSHDPSLEPQLTEIVADTLGMEPEEIQVNTSLDEYGFDSILLMQFIQKLHNQIDPSLDVTLLRECRTIRDIVNVLQSQKRASTVESKPQEQAPIPVSYPQFPELIRLNQGTHGRPVFWVHSVFGGVEGYHLIAQKSKRPFYGIQARGWMTDRAAVYGIEGMAMYYVHIIQTVQPKGPYDLGGYSLGGILAYEIARQLQKKGEVVNSIVMLDAMHLTGQDEIKTSKKGLILQAVNMGLLSAILQQPEKISRTLIHRDELDFTLEDKDFLEDLMERAKARGLNKTDKQIQNLILHTVKIQQAYGLHLYQTPPLPDPQAVTCYFFRNRDGLFFGELEPYFVTADDEVKMNDDRYWEEWQRLIPATHMFDLDTSNHMMFLTERKAYETVSAFCEALYSEKGVSNSFLHSFKRKTKKLHNKVRTR